MAKYYGAIGFKHTVANPEFTSEYLEVIEEKYYKGTLESFSRRLQNATDGIHDNLISSMRLRIVIDDYMGSNYAYIAYITNKGIKWKVDSVDISNYPEAILTTGGVYNADTTTV